MNCKRKSPRDTAYNVFHPQGLRTRWEKHCDILMNILSGNTQIMGICTYLAINSHNMRLLLNRSEPQQE